MDGHEAIPLFADLRPLVPLEGGRFATSTERPLSASHQPQQSSQKLIDIQARKSFCATKSDVAGGVDALFDNGADALRRAIPNALRSLSDL